MFKKLRDWLDERTNYRSRLAPLRRRVLPEGPAWGNTTANCLLWVLVIVLITGFLLMSSYSPSTTSAWPSVHYIEKSSAGSFVRGLHFYGAQAIIILFGVHTVRVLAKAGFRAPHELIWITGLLLIPLVVIWAITGNPLNGTQRGFSQIEVEGNIIASTPGGWIVQRLLIGGDEVGNLTLTHLYFLHVALLPLVVGLLLWIHLGQVYRHGLPAQHAELTGRARPYWPYQSFRNMIVFGIVFGIIAALAWRHGAPLDAPADPDLPSWTRPEWYFLFLFELRSYFVGQNEYIATVVLPMLTLVVLLAMPLIDRWSSPMVSGVIRGLAIVVGLGAFGVLTFASVWRDWHDDEHLALVAEAEAHAERARFLADRTGIPPEGAITLLRNDAQTQGPLLFTRHCASCHPHLNADGEGIVSDAPSAPNLFEFARADWIAGMLDPDRIASDEYYGQTALVDGEMVTAIVDAFDAAEDDAEKATLRQQMQKVALALAAEAGGTAGQPQAAEVAEGIELLTGDLGCTDCHRFHDEGDLGAAPDLTGYGSRDWLSGIIGDPTHERFYGEGNDRMPAFASEPAQAEQNLLSNHELEMLVTWLHGEPEETETLPSDAAELATAEPAPAQVAAQPPETKQTESEPPPEQEAQALGERLFRRRCARCHGFLDENGEGIAGPKPRDSGEPNGGPDLHGFAARSWLAGLLDPEQIGANHYFGNTALAEGEMVGYVQDMLVDLDDESTTALSQMIAALSAEAQLPAQAELDAKAKQDGTIEAGTDALINTFGCTDCHKFHDEGDLGASPDLTGYGSLEWLIGIIANPEHERFYPDTNDRMPAFAADPDNPVANVLTDVQIEAIAKWIRGES